MLVKLVVQLIHLCYIRIQFEYERNLVAKQTVTLRLDEDDLTYLSQVEINGAGNLSEKIRALISEARAQRDGTKDYTAAYDFSRRLFADLDRQIHAAEIECQARSELTHRLLAWLPEAVAYTLSGDALEQSPSKRSEGLEQFETGIGERAFSLVDSMLQLAQADFSGCLEKKKLAKRAHFAVQKTP